MNRYRYQDGGEWYLLNILLMMTFGDVDYSSLISAASALVSLFLSSHLPISSQAHINIVFNCSTSSFAPPLTFASFRFPSINSRHLIIQCPETKSQATLIQLVKLHTYINSFTRGRYLMSTTRWDKDCVAWILVDPPRFNIMFLT